VIAVGGTLGAMLPRHRARGLRHHHPAGHRKTVHLPRGCRLLAILMQLITIGIIGVARPGFLPAGRKRHGTTVWSRARRPVTAIAVSVRDRRPLWRLLHPDRSRRGSAPSAPLIGLLRGS